MKRKIDRMTEWSWNPKILEWWILMNFRIGKQMVSSACSSSRLHRPQDDPNGLKPKVVSIQCTKRIWAYCGDGQFAEQRLDNKQWLCANRTALNQLIQSGIFSLEVVNRTTDKNCFWLSNNNRIHQQINNTTHQLSSYQWRNVNIVSAEDVRCFWADRSID